jgi:hypothetical protein
MTEKNAKILTTEPKVQVLMPMSGHDAQLVRSCSWLTENSHSQKPITGPYPEQNVSTPY